MRIEAAIETKRYRNTTKEEVEVVYTVLYGMLNVECVCVVIFLLLLLLRFSLAQKHLVVAYVRRSFI